MVGGPGEEGYPKEKGTPFSPTDAQTPPRTPRRGKSSFALVPYNSFVSALP